MVHPQLFTKDVLPINIQIIPQDGTILRKKAKISSLDLTKTVFVKSNKRDGISSEPGHPSFGEMQKKQITELNNRLREVEEYKDKVKKLSDNDQDLSKVMGEITDRLRIEYKLDDRDSTLQALGRLEKETKNLKFQLEKIDFKSFNLRKRCEELIDVNGAPGICYEISNPTISAKAQTKTFRFSSQSEKFEMNKAVMSINHKEAVGPFVGFAYGGFGVASSETSKTNNSYDVHQSKELSLKGKEAVAVTRASQEIGVFKIKRVTLGEEGRQLAEEIGNQEDEKEQEKLALKFLDKFPSEINMGKFGVGGWFQYTATTRSSELTTVYQLQAEAARQSEERFSMAVKAFYGAVGGQFGTSDSNEITGRIGENYKSGKKDTSMTTTFDYDCSGPTVSDINKLQENLTNPDYLAVFPSIGGNHSFEKIYDIVRDMGRDLKNDALVKAANVLMRTVENGPKHSVRNPRIPPKSTQKNVVVFGKTGSGKSLLGLSLIHI